MVNKGQTQVSIDSSTVNIFCLHDVNFVVLYNSRQLQQNKHIMLKDNLTKAFKELDAQGYLDDILMAFHSVDGAIKEIAQVDTAGLTFDEVYQALRDAQ